ncbi:MAG: ATP synthase F1 subunit epsilon [Lachnospiraceae bacterium]|nr:ATP synthase F1 subunit epsilon [Lachnospiraceae bacterium]
MEDNKYFDLEIISPERVFFEGKAHFLELTTSEGEMGIYKNHIPMTTVLVPCVVTIHMEEGEKLAAVHAGFVLILQDKITIMAEVAEWPEEIDVNRANEAKLRAERRLKSGGDDVNVHRAELALKRSLVRLQATKKI